MRSHAGTPGAAARTRGPATVFADGANHPNAPRYCGTGGLAAVSTSAGRSKAAHSRAGAAWTRDPVVVRGKTSHHSAAHRSAHHRNAVRSRVGSTTVGHGASYANAAGGATRAHDPVATNAARGDSHPRATHRGHAVSSRSDGFSADGSGAMRTGAAGGATRAREPATADPARGDSHPSAAHRKAHGGHAVNSRTRGPTADGRGAKYAKAADGATRAREPVTANPARGDRHPRAAHRETHGGHAISTRTGDFTANGSGAVRTGAAGGATRAREPVTADPARGDSHLGVTRRDGRAVSSRVGGFTTDGSGVVHADAAGDATRARDRVTTDADRGGSLPGAAHREARGGHAVDSRVGVFAAVGSGTVCVGGSGAGGPARSGQPGVAGHGACGSSDFGGGTVAGASGLVAAGRVGIGWHGAVGSGGARGVRLDGREHAAG
ncbi:hypothetical protein LV75_005419 [Actinokineospora diospyrosa]|uniref:Uncharacterized protein n=1 Tax=Actinokineospora diospyrosa TaxID=103728 RepID=A0ABT1IJR5_9PSEU|nr:hypothetical protein [Actinokineospora diospyrosa]